MSTDVNKAIQELLFEQTAVIVPGLGGFTSTPGSAMVDYVQDLVTPPASKLEFNPNLVINDGVLVQYLQKGNLSTYQEAEGLVEKYVSAVRETLERREIYEIPKVGRLYQDYEHKIRFMPEGTNFNADSFGLPTIEFQPLVKEKPKTLTTPTRPNAEAGEAFLDNTNSEVSEAASPVEDQPGNMLMKALPWLVLLAAILIALAVYSIFGGKKPAPIAADVEPTERVNVKPTLPDANLSDKETSSTTPVETPTSPENTTPPASNPGTTKESATPNLTTPEQTDAGTSKDMIYLVVHSFGVKRNASNFSKTLSTDGYSPQTKKVGSLFRVGVMIPKEPKANFERIRKELAAKYQAGPKTEKELEEMGQ